MFLSAWSCLPGAQNNVTFPLHLLCGRVPRYGARSRLAAPGRRAAQLLCLVEEHRRLHAARLAAPAHLGPGAHRRGRGVVKGHPPPAQLGQAHAGRVVAQVVAGHGAEAVPRRGAGRYAVVQLPQVDLSRAVLGRGSTGEDSLLPQHPHGIDARGADDGKAGPSAARPTPRARRPCPRACSPTARMVAPIAAGSALWLSHPSCSVNTRGAPPSREWHTG